MALHSPYATTIWDYINRGMPMNKEGTLAPDEVYWPSYTNDPGYIRNVNITNVSITKITNITNVIVNQPASVPPSTRARSRIVGGVSI